MRVVTAVAAIPVVLAAIWFGGWAFMLFVMAISAGALMEYYWIAEKKGLHPQKLIGVLAGLALVLAFAHGPHAPIGGGQDLFLIHYRRLATVVGGLMLLTLPAMIIEMYRQRGSSMLNLAATLSGVLYVSLSLAALVGIREFFSGVASSAAITEEADHVGAYMVAAVVVSIWICDSGAYYCGRAFGRHKLFERISPKKTWEGAIGGAVAAVGAMVGFRFWLLPQLELANAVAIGLIVGVFGQLGDLAESQLKRDAGVKDSSQLIPGHGGLLDRFDSLIFVAPLVYLYMVIASLLR
jgi:phosphatidate cytidylyltransferase